MFQEEEQHVRWGTDKWCIQADILWQVRSFPTIELEFEEDNMIYLIVLS